MALQKSWDDEFGATHASAYARVIRIDMDIEHATATATVGIYVDSAARNAGKKPFQRRSYNFDTLSGSSLVPSTASARFADLFAVGVLNTKNPTKSVYDHIKTLSEWSGATDV